MSIVEALERKIKGTTTLYILHTYEMVIGIYDDITKANEDWSVCRDNSDYCNVYMTQWKLNHSPLIDDLRKEKEDE